MRKILIVIGAVAVFAVGCGGSSNNASPPVSLSGRVNNKGTKDLKGTAVDLEIDDFSFTPSFVRGGAPGTAITVHLTNKGQQLHNFTVRSQGIDTTLNPGDTVDVQLTLPPSGATEFHCRFHLQSDGMQGAFFFKDGDAVTSASP